MAKKKNTTVTKEAINAWANSRKAKVQIETAFKRSKQTVAKLQRARQIDPESLDKPITM